MTTEIWKPVVGYEGRYEVSNLGRVRSVDFKVRCGLGGKGTRIVKGRVLMPGRSRSGHHSVALGKSNSKMVHVIVCEAFQGPKPTSSHEVMHCDHDPSHNAAVNLFWGSRSENIQHDYDNGSRVMLKVPVRVVDTRTGQKAEFTSLTEASKFLGKPYSSYARYYLKTQRTTSSGFKVEPL